MTAIGALPRSGGAETARDGGDASAPEPRSRTGGRLSRPGVILPVVSAVLAATLVMALAEAQGPSGPGVGEAIVTVHGKARVARAEGASEIIKAGVRLEPGDRIDLLEGTADFELADGITYEGVASRGKTADTSVLMDRTPTLRSGRLLVRGPKGASLHLGIADITVRPGGVARIQRSYSATVASYQGTTTVSSAGVKQDVPALRSVQAASPGEITSRRPIEVNGDAWDQEYLADAISLDGRLGPLARGMRSAKIDPKDLLAAVRGALPKRPSPTTVRGLGKNRPIRLDLGIGLAVIGSGSRGTFATRAHRALQFHDAGAGWGLVAMDIDADPEDVVAVLAEALDDDILPAGADRIFDAAGIDGIGGGLLGAGGVDGTNVAGTDADGNPISGGTTPDGLPVVTTPGIPGVTTPGIPGVTTPNVPGVTTPTLPGVTTPTVPGVTTPAVPAIPVIPGVTTPTVPSVPIVPTVTGVVTTITGVVGTLLPPLTTTTTRPRATTTTQTTICVLIICL